MSGTEKKAKLAIEFTRPPELDEGGKVLLLPDGNLRFFDKDGNELVPPEMTRTVQYDRPKGPKVQSHIALDGNSVSISGIEELAKFEAIVAIDTNTPQPIDGPRISVACFVVCQIRPEGDSYKVVPEPQFNIYEFRNVPGNPEFIAILKVCNDILRSSPRPELRFAVVTDSELGRHKAINARRESLYGNAMLPQGFTLVYASAETGQEVGNRLLRFCDKQAGKFFSYIEDGSLPAKEPAPLSEEPSVLYRYFSNSDIEVLNPIIRGRQIQEGSEVSIYGVGKPRTPPEAE